MNEIDELLERARSLVQSQKKGPKNRSGNDTFIYQNRPVHNTDWFTERDVTYISIYLPTRIPSFGGLPFKSIVLHSHTVFQPCTRDRFCHVLGWNVDEHNLNGFNRVWNYLYNPTAHRNVKLGEMDLNI